MPSDVPSDVPSEEPSDVPSQSPSVSPSDIPSRSPSSFPSTTPPTPFPTVTIGDFFIYGNVYRFPFDVHTVATGSIVSTYPLYQLSSFSVGAGTFSGLSLTGEGVTVTVNNIVTTWAELQAAQTSVDADLATFMTSISYSAVVVSGTLQGSSGVDGFIGAVSTYNDPQTDATVNLLYVYAHPNANPMVPARRRSLTVEQEGETWTKAEINAALMEAETETGETTLEAIEPFLPVSMVEAIHHGVPPPTRNRRMQVSSDFVYESPNKCPTFVQVAQSTVADTCDAGEVLVTDDSCVSATQASYATNAQQLDQTYTTSVITLNTTVLLERSVGMTYGLAHCVHQVFSGFSDVQTCMHGFHTRTSTVETNSRVNIQITLAAVRTSIDDSYTSLCQTMITGAETCFECQPCTLDNSECCTTADCLDQQLGTTCAVNFVCVNEGNPRFTLSWTGDDDLDIHVITPGGFHIYWVFTNLRDPTTGGQLDRDDVGQAGVVADYVENIYFPNTGPAGVYTFWVDQWMQRGGSDDPWELNVFVDGFSALTRMGVADSANFTYTYSP